MRIHQKPMVQRQLISAEVYDPRNDDDELFETMKEETPSDQERNIITAVKEHGFTEVI